MQQNALPENDEQTLARLGYAQELHRGLGAFSNFALSLSIICILAGGVTSFHLGLASVGGAAIGIGWPVCCLFSLVVAATMAQVASAFPTAGGLYHWAAILGGKGWGFVTAWFNLAGLITVLAAINVGTYLYAVSVFGIDLERLPDWQQILVQSSVVFLITGSQALINHLGIRLTARLTDFSGYWILFISLALTLALLVCAPSLDPGRLFRFENFSGLPEGKPVWPARESVAVLFLLGMLLPAYTVTGFDASAHAAEETLQAAVRVPRGIVRSVLVSGLFGWVMLCATILAAPDLREAASQGEGAFVWIVRQALPGWLAWLLLVAILLAQYLCGLATVTSAPRMLFAFARDGGVPWSGILRRVHSTYRTPVPAIWTVALASVAFTIYSPVYSTITLVCVLFLYVSYMLPILLGMIAHGRTWTTMGPWNLGAWYRPLAFVALLGCTALFIIGVQPPNTLALWTTLGTTAILCFAVSSWSFRGPPTVS